MFQAFMISSEMPFITVSGIGLVSIYLTPFITVPGLDLVSMYLTPFISGLGVLSPTEEEEWSGCHAAESV